MKGNAAGLARSPTCPHSGLDFIIFDVPEGLPIPGLFVPPNDIPAWNVYENSHIEALFEFADSLLHDNGVILIFLPESPSIKMDVKSYVASYDFKIFKDWWGINELRLTSLLCSDHTVSDVVTTFLYLSLLH